MEKIFSSCLIATVVVLSPLRAQEGRLQIGETVPQLEVARWLFGDPADTLEPGKYYLIEFTHLYCRPCREAIPHLTEIARKYKGRLNVISIYSYFAREDRKEVDYAAEIMQLKRRMGDDMVYTLALDKRNGITNQLWNANQGFPATYLVDDEGRLAWHGMASFDQLDAAANALINSTRNVTELQQRYERFSQLYQEVMRHIESATYHELLSAANQLTDDFPEYLDYSQRVKLYVMLKHDIDAANNFLSQTQSAQPTWTFNPRMLVMDTQNRLETDLVLENFDREIHAAVDTLLVAGSLFSKARYLVEIGRPDQALPIFAEVKFLRLKVGAAGGSRAIELNGWIQMADYLAIQQQDGEAAERWLGRQLEQQSLSQYAAIGLTTLFKSMVIPEQLEALALYIEEE